MILGSFTITSTASVPIDIEKRVHDLIESSRSSWSFTVPFSLNVIRYFAPSNIEVCRHAGDRKELNSFAQWETGSVFTRRELRTRKIGSLKFTGN